MSFPRKFNYTGIRIRLTIKKDWIWIHLSIKTSSVFDPNRPDQILLNHMIRAAPPGKKIMRGEGKNALKKVITFFFRRIKGVKGLLSKCTIYTPAYVLLSSQIQLCKVHDKSLRQEKSWNMIKVVICRAM